MAHFAQLDENNVVLQVIVVHNNELVASKESTINEDGSVSVSVTESEQMGVAFCQSLFGADTRWVQTSYNGNFRGKYAGIGDTYDAENNVFVAPVVDQVDIPVVPGIIEMVTPMVQSADIQSLTTADIPALTTTDISSLG